MGGKKKKGGAKKKGKGSAPAATSAVSSAEQMAYRIQSLESELESSRERVKRLSHENEELRRTREKVEKDTHEFVAYFQKEMEKKDDLVADLRYNLRQTEMAKEKELRSMRDKFASEMEQKDNEYTATDRELRLRLKTVEEDLSMLYDFKAHKKELEGKLREQEQQLIEKDLSHQKQLADVERKFIEEKGRLQREHDRQLKTIKKRSREEAQKDLDADTRRIITDNRRMGEELRFQLKTTDELQAAKTSIEQENRRMKRELALYDDKEGQYAKDGHRKTREIRELTAQVQTLEKSLSQVVRDFERERETLESKHKEMSEGLVLEVNGLKQLIKLKNKELRTIKRLAQTILQQRTEVEQFFLDALSNVKGEIARARAEHKAKSKLYGSGRRTTAAATTFPRLDSGSPRPPPSEKVDLVDLTLEDRERVLRLLFAKINNVQTYAGSFNQSSAFGSSAAPESAYEEPGRGGGSFQLPTAPGAVSGGSRGGRPGVLSGPDGVYGSTSSAQPHLA